MIYVFNGKRTPRTKNCFRVGELLTQKLTPWLYFDNWFIAILWGCHTYQ